MSSNIVIFIAILIVIAVVVFLWGYTQSSGQSAGSGSLAETSGCDPIQSSGGSFTNSSPGSQS